MNDTQGQALGAPLLRDVLAGAMRARGYSGADLGRELGVTSAAVYGWLKGTEPQPRFRIKIERWLASHADVNGITSTEAPTPFAGRVS